jgi:hypothetical protein
MGLKRIVLALTGAGLLAAAVGSVPAAASGQADPKPHFSNKTVGAQSVKTLAASECGSWIGVANAAGTIQEIDAIPVGRHSTAYAFEPDPFVATRADSTWYLASNASGSQIWWSGLLLQGANLYRHTTYVTSAGLRPTFKKVGTGWTSFKSIATSNYSYAKPRHSYLYGLNTNGSLYRYQDLGTGFRSLGPLPGFRSFKAMTVISETATYDTLLMTTKAGALYTVRIPIAAGAKPVLKLIRSTGFAQYESLVVHGCGTRGGSLVVGVDHDAQTATQYAMSKMNGAATAITSYGPVPATFDGVSHVALTTYYDQLVGE